MYKNNRIRVVCAMLLGVACLLGTSLDARAPKRISESSGQVGEFSREGEYMKDYFVFKEGRTFHLFYNVGEANDTQDWQEPNSEKAFGHATSTDLVHWEHHPRVMAVIPGTWDRASVWRPARICIIGNGALRIRSLPHLNGQCAIRPDGKIAVTRTSCVTTTSFCCLRW